MTKSVVSTRFTFMLIVSLTGLTSAAGDVPEILLQRQEQLFTALEKVRGSVVGVTDGTGVGSGVVVSADGLVLTASHVVDSGRGGPRRRRAEPPDRPVRVIFPDGSNYAATVLGKNRDADAALLKISDPAPGERGFPFAEMGKTNETFVGEWCFALGHPGGYRQTREAPIRIGRILSVGKRTVVSDCAILLGDSGGPLFNMKGQIIGIHSMITSLIIENRHVAIDAYHDNWDRMLNAERWGRLRSADNDLVSSEFFGVELKWKDFVPEVNRVLTNSPAEKAGLRKGDILLKIQGAPIADRLDLGTTLDLLEVEQQIEVTLRRDSAETVVPLVTGRLSESGGDPDESGGSLRRGREDTERDREIEEQLSETRRIGSFEKRTSEILELFRASADENSNSVAAIRDGGLLLCLGTVVSSDGYILTKASEIVDALEPEAIFPDGRRFPAKAVGSDYEFDLTLLKVDAGNLQPVTLRDRPARAGELAVIQDQRGNPYLPTVVSVEAHTMESASKAFLGVRPVEDQNGVRIAQVIAGGAAQRSGLKDGDIIMSVAGRDVQHPEELISRIGAFKPGDKVAIRFMRSDRIQTMEITLTSRFTNENPLLPLYNLPEFMGQFASTHSGGFPRAMQIDADVFPRKVGGPLLDLEGRTLGIVIARADRYPTYVIPAEEIASIFRRLKEQGTVSATTLTP